ncbi:hypothetical protein GX48_01353 [Paracoccidioides brasiliensis]|nr:hypothetical protein GX48_01353 [Paracoccidioides brasiliensis]
MPFLIVLDNPQTVWSPGSIIQGKVVLNSAQDEALSSVTISFLGKAKTRFRTSDGGPYTGRVQFFSYFQQLFRGNYTFSASKRLEWPFQFVFPDTPVNKQSDVTQGNFLRRMDGYPLPPTFSYESVYLTSNETHCRIQYQLSAELQRPSSFSLSSGTVRAQKSLNFTPHRSEASPATNFSPTPSTWTVFSKKILPEYENYEPTMKEKVTSIFSSKTKLPGSAFRIITKLPDKVVLGQSIPLLVSATHLPELSTTEIIPIIRLRHLSLTLRTHTSFCGISTWGGTHDGNKDEKLIVAHRTNLDIPLESQPCHLGWPLNNPCLQSLAPSFVSDIIRRSYSLHLKIMVECAECTKSIHASRMWFDVMSSSYSQEPLGPAPIEEDVVAVVVEEEEEEEEEMRMCSGVVGRSWDHAPEYDFVDSKGNQKPDLELPAYQP